MKNQEIIKSAISFDCKETEPCAREITFTVTAEGVGAAFNDAAKNAVKYAKLPGFRAGKAPRKIVEQYYGVEVLFADAEENVKIASMNLGGVEM